MTCSFFARRLTACLRAGQSPLRARSGATMFLGRGARSVGSVGSATASFSWNFAGAAQVGTKLPAHAVTWPRGVGCARAHDGRIQDRADVCAVSERLEERVARSTGCRLSWTPVHPGHVVPVQMISASTGFSAFRRAESLSVLRVPEWFSVLTSRATIARALSTAAERNPVPEKTAAREQPGGGGEEPEREQKQSKRTQLKKIFKEYGAVGVSFHVGISLISLGIFYVAVSSGINMTAMLCKLGFSESVVQSKMAAGTSTFVLAYAVHKLFAPLRISITLVSVPLIVRYLRKTGLFKPPPTDL